MHRTSEKDRRRHKSEQDNLEKMISFSSSGKAKQYLEQSFILQLYEKGANSKNVTAYRRPNRYKMATRILINMTEEPAQLKI